jgi:predicted DNA binding protein
MVDLERAPPLPTQSQQDRIPQARARLTARQREILLHCVRCGYYDIPRKMTLRQVAREVGISSTSLSLLLRRAERELVNSFAASTLADDEG